MFNEATSTRLGKTQESLEKFRTRIWRRPSRARSWNPASLARNPLATTEFTGRPDCPSVLTFPENFDSHRWRSCDRKLQRIGDRTYKRSGNLVAKHGGR